MIIDFSYLQSPVVESFVVALLHSLWQGVLISFALTATLRALPAKRTTQRYVVSLLGLTVIVMSVLITWAWQNYATDQIASQRHQTAHVDAPAEHDIAVGGSVTAQPAVHSSVAIETADSEMAASQQLSLSTARTPRTFVPYFASFWCLGALLMLLRGVWLFGSAQSLVRQSQPAPVEWALRLETLRTQLGLHFDIGVKISEVIGSPMVIGAFKPVVLMPASLAAGLSVQEMDAILAHELAHIQRRDYLINAFQILVESLLFFNPAVWWISRQVRLEREACCDAAGAKLSHGQIHFAEVLANVAARALPVHQPTPAMAMTGPERSSLVDRVKRLVEPKYQPGMRLPWPTCIFLLFACSAALFVTFQATQVVVAVAAEVMSDEERVAVLTEEADEIPSAVNPTFDKITLSGTLTLPDGYKFPQLVPESVDLSVSSRSEGRSVQSSRKINNPETGTFSIAVPSGTTVNIIAHVPNLAPVHLGPFTPQDGPKISGQDISFQSGDELPIQVVDDDGKPAKDVLVRAFAKAGSMGTFVGKVTTDDNGSGQFEHMTSEIPYTFWLSGSGYQPKRIETDLIDLSQQLKLTISRAQPTSGIVYDEQDKPLPGVEVRQFFEKEIFPSGAIRDHTLESGLLATTNEQGEFVLTSLSDDQVVYAILMHPDYAPTLLPEVIPGEKDLSVTMQKGVRVSGVIRGAENVSKLTRVLYKFPVQIPDSKLEHRDSFDFRDYAKVTNDDGILQFDLGRILPGQLRLNVAHQWFPFAITEDRDDLVVNYAAPDGKDPEIPFRDLVLRFHDHGKPVKPTGRLEIYTHNSKVDFELNKHLAEVQDGMIQVPAPIPSEFWINSTSGLIGYWINTHDVERCEIEPGDGPKEIEIPVYPAGAVKGRVVNARGEPAVGYNMSARFEIVISDEKSYSQRGFYNSSGVSAKTNRDGEFFLTPIPLGAKCRVTAADGFYREVGPEFEITEEKPLVTKDIQLGPSDSLEVTVVDPDGSPMPRLPVQLSFRKFDDGMSWGPPLVTDAHGKVHFTGLNLGPGGQYYVEAQPVDLYVPTRIKIGRDLPNRIKLAKGLTVQGRVLDMDGNPVSGVKVRAMPQDSMRDLGLEGWEAVPNYVAKERTDNQGRFVISQLPDIPLRLTADGVHADNFFEFDPSRDSEVTYQGQIADWFRKKMSE